MTRLEIDDDDLRTLLLESIDLFCVAGIDGYFRWVSPAWVRAVGWNVEELCASPFIKRVHPDDVEHTVAEVKRLEQGQPSIELENRFLHRSGAWVWLQWNIVPKTDGLLYCTVREVTHHKEVEDLADRRARYLSMAEELAHVGHWYVDLRSERMSWSDEVFRIHGLPPGQEPTLAEGIDFYHPDDREIVTRHLEAAIREKRGFAFELRLIRGEGEVRYVESRGRVQRDDAGEAAGVFGVFMDITDRVEQQRELEGKRRKLQQFVHVASHDLQEPLRTMSAYLEQLTERYGDRLDERGQRFMTYARDAAGRMKSLVDDVLEFSRSSQSRVSLSPVRLDTLIDDIEDDLEVLLRECGATLTREGDLPTLQSDPALLRLVLQNLVSNAVKFRRPEVAPRCSIACETSANGMILRVADNGIGIPRDQLRRIFEPFARLHGAGSYDGNGIGLAIVIDAVEALGGRIEVDSVVGEGTTFTVRVSR